MTKKTEAPASGLRYVGGGAYIMGVPARDLSPDEAMRYAAAIKQVAEAGQPLYEPAPGLESPASAGAEEESNGA